MHAHMVTSPEDLLFTKIFEGRFCVNQTVVKRNMVARKNYLFRDKNVKKAGQEAG